MVRHSASCWVIVSTCRDSRAPVVVFYKLESGIELAPSNPYPRLTISLFTVWGQPERLKSCQAADCVNWLEPLVLKIHMSCARNLFLIAGVSQASDLAWHYLPSLALASQGWCGTCLGSGYLLLSSWSTARWLQVLNSISYIMLIFSKSPTSLKPNGADSRVLPHDTCNHTGNWEIAWEIGWGKSSSAESY